MVGIWTLNPSILVRFQAPQQYEKRVAFATSFSYCWEEASKLFCLRLGIEQRSHVSSADETGELVPRKIFVTTKIYSREIPSPAALLHLRKAEGSSVPSATKSEEVPEESSTKGRYLWIFSPTYLNAATSHSM